MWARDNQLVPVGDWSLWLVLAGRGYGKTRVGAETTNKMVREGFAKRVGFIAPTSGDARDVMIEGESGLLATAPPWFMPKYEPSKRRVTWPNGVKGFLYSAEEPERLRGPQHDWIWGDEPASWDPDGLTWKMAKFGLRLGTKPRAVITGTPKPIPLILDWLKSAKTHVTRGSTYENSANLAADFLEDVTALYAGTRLGRQELNAEVLEDADGGLFNQVLIDNARVMAPPVEMQRIVIAIDPAPTSERKSDETGMMVVGLGSDGHGYVLEDVSGNFTPDEWARRAVKAFYKWQADRIVAEVNSGGDLVESNLRTVDENVPFEGVRARRGKAKRAEPIGALFEQGKVHMVGPAENWTKLERQMRVFTGNNGRRDDRTDAMCWGLHHLMLGARAAFV